MYGRSLGVLSHIEYVHTVATETRHYQLVPLLGWVSVAAAAAVPTKMMDFIPRVQHFSPVDNL